MLLLSLLKYTYLIKNIYLSQISLLMPLARRFSNSCFFLFSSLVFISSFGFQYLVLTKYFCSNAYVDVLKEKTIFINIFYFFSSCGCYSLQIYTIFFKQTNIFIDLLIILAINQEICNKM